MYKNEQTILTFYVAPNIQTSQSQLFYSGKCTQVTRMVRCIPNANNATPSKHSEFADKASVTAKKSQRSEELYPVNQLQQLKKL